MRGAVVYVAILVSAQAGAVCKVLMPSNVEFTSPVVPAGDQPVIVRVWQKTATSPARETLIVGPTFLQVGGTFALVVPVPASPLVRLAPPDIYNDAAKAEVSLIKSTIVEVEDISMGCQAHDPAFYSTAGSTEYSQSSGGGGAGCGGGGGSVPTGNGISGGTSLYGSSYGNDTHVALGSETSGCGGGEASFDSGGYEVGAWEGPTAAEDAGFVFVPQDAGEDATLETHDSEDVSTDDVEEDTEGSKADDPGECGTTTTTQSGAAWVTDHKLLGGYEIAILEGEFDGDVSAWLDANGFLLGEADSQLLRDYSKAGWSFVALKLSDVEDDAGTIQLDPVEITFDIPDGPVMPVRIGWSPLVGKLDFNVWAIGWTAYTTLQHATITYAASLSVSQLSGLSQYAGTGDVLTRFDYSTITEPPLWETLETSSIRKQNVIENTKTYKVPVKQCTYAQYSGSSGSSGSSASRSGKSGSSSCFGCAEVPRRSNGVAVFLMIIAAVWWGRRARDYGAAR